MAGDLQVIIKTKSSIHKMSLVSQVKGPHTCWDLRLDELSTFSTKTMIAGEDVESKHSTELKHQD